MPWYGKQFVAPVVLAQYQTDGQEGQEESGPLSKCPKFDDKQYRIPGDQLPTLEDVVFNQLTLVTPDINFWYIISNGHVVAEGQAPAMLAYMSEFVQKLEEVNGIEWVCPEQGAPWDHEVAWDDE